MVYKVVLIFLHELRRQAELKTKRIQGVKERCLAYKETMTMEERRAIDLAAADCPSLMRDEDSSKERKGASRGD